MRAGRGAKDAGRDAGSAQQNARDAMQGARDALRSALCILRETRPSGRQRCRLRAVMRLHIGLRLRTEAASRA
ncbi:hypothetical protein GCM10008966_32610 [Rhodovulum strictum]